MVKVGDMYIDGYLQSNLDLAADAVKKDWDMLFIVDGEEGSGKSVLALQGAWYLDRTLNLSRICFTPKEFKEAVVKAKQYEAVVYDEAMTGLNSRQALSQVNIMLVQMLAEIRQKNLFVFIVLPCFFELDKYPAIWRSRALFHVYSKGFDRGQFAFFNFKRKKALYMNGKKFYSYSNPSANFIGSFTNHYPIDEQEYRAKKLKSLRDKIKEKESPNSYHKKQKEHRDCLLYWVNKELGYNYKEISRELGKYVQISPDTISKVVNRLEKAISSRNKSRI